MDAISYSGFRKDLRHYMSQVNDDSERLVVTTKDPNDTVVVMGKRDYDSLLETMHILSNPGLVAQIHEGQAQFSAGKAKAHELRPLTDD